MEERRYPSCCTSYYCGKFGDKCIGCSELPTLQRFKQWCEDHKAIQPDPIWCPGLYRATI